jgi:hypothetical protein
MRRRRDRIDQPEGDTKARPRRHRLRPAAVAVSAVVLVLVPAACGSDDADHASPPLGTGAGVFGALPRYPGSDAVGARTSADGVTVRSFSVSNTTPEQILTWYVAELPDAGWSVLEDPGPEAKTWRGTWQRDRRRLLISAAPAPTIDDKGASVGNEVQYSLTLGDPGAPVAPGD